MLGYRRKSWNNSYYPYRYKTSKGRAIQSIKAANNQNSTINFSLKVNYAFSARYEAGSDLGVAAINIYDVLMKSENFINLMKMYDTVKVNGVNVRINVVDAETSIASVNAIKSLNVVTAWDKSGLSVSDVTFVDGSDNEVIKEDYDTAKCLFYKNTIGKKITGYGSCKKGLLNQYQKFTRFEKCWPTTLEEKGCYIQTDLFNEFCTSVDVSTSKCEVSGDYSDQSINTVIAQPNPVIPFETLNLKWKPTLLVGVFQSSIAQNGSVTQYGTTPPVLFNAEFTIPCTFKGLKGDS